MARRQFAARLIHTCTINQYTEGTADSHGQKAITYPALATGVACLYMPEAHRLIPGQEIKDRRQDVLLSDWIVFMAYRTDVTEKDRITDIKNAAGTVLEAGPLNIRLIKNAGGQSHHLELHVASVK